MPSKYTILPDSGSLMVSTDLHGNYEDFIQLRKIFAAQKPDTHWAILGDIVHGPSIKHSQRNPDLYGFADQSWDIAEGVISLKEKYPDKIHYVLGNHDHGHIGGPHTAKFYKDEVEHLEEQLNSKERQIMHNFFKSALLAVIAPCGVILTHGSPGDELQKLDDLDSISWDPSKNDDYQTQVLKTFLTSYGQQHEVSARFLQTISQIGFKVNVDIHGHDRSLDGYFIEGKNQLCPVIFGAYHTNKRYLLLDLGGDYRDVDDFRENIEILKLY